MLVDCVMCTHAHATLYCVRALQLLTPSLTLNSEYRVHPSPRMGALLPKSRPTVGVGVAAYTCLCVCRFRPQVMCLLPELSTVPPCIVNSSCMRRLPAYGRVRLRALGMIGSLPQQSSGELNKPHTPCAALGGCDFAGACDGASVCSLVGFCSVKRTLLAILLAARSSFSQVARHCAEG